MSNEAITTVASTGLDAKRAEARAYLGQKWVSHPDYVPSARHSNNPEIYQLARTLYLHKIANAAAFARQHNPAFHRANHLRIAVGQ